MKNTKKVHLLACLGMIALSSCTPYESKTDVHFARELMTDDLEDQIMWNLIRAYNGIPFSHYEVQQIQSGKGNITMFLLSISGSFRHSGSQWSLESQSMNRLNSRYLTHKQTSVPRRPPKALVLELLRGLPSSACDV